MKFFDTVTGNTLETDNQFVIDQLKQDTKRYTDPPKPKKAKETDKEPETI